MRSLKNLITMTSWRKIYRLLVYDKEVRNLEDTLSELKRLTMVGFTGYQDIRSVVKDWPVGLSKSLQGNDTILIKKEDNCFQFVTIITPDSGFPVHHHDVEETVEVLKGELHDLIINTGTLRRGDTYEYPKGKPHMPYNKSMDKDCILLVTFRY